MEQSLKEKIEKMVADLNKYNYHSYIISEVFSYFEIFIIIPQVIKVISIDEPPWEKNGSGIPVEGKAPQTTPQFIRDWITMIVPQPKANKLLKKSSQLMAIL